MQNYTKAYFAAISGVTLSANTRKHNSSMHTNPPAYISVAMGGGGKWGQLPPTVARLDPEICVNPMRNIPGEIRVGTPVVGRIKTKQKLN